MTAPTIARKEPVAVKVEAGKDYWWCACGLSKSQPFCDGSHKVTDFRPVQWTAERSGQKYFCCCKHTKGQPFCDGTHKTL
jgi:CDGSH iron-sulfur domain-containing protein 3